MNPPAVRLGLGANLPQFSLLVLVNAFVGAMVGMERSILSPIAEAEFGLTAHTAMLSYIVVFGVTRSPTTLPVAWRMPPAGRRCWWLVSCWPFPSLSSHVGPLLGLDHQRPSPGLRRETASGGLPPARHFWDWEPPWSPINHLSLRQNWPFFLIATFQT